MFTPPVALPFVAGSKACSAIFAAVAARWASTHLSSARTAQRGPTASLDHILSRAREYAHAARRADINRCVAAARACSARQANFRLHCVLRAAPTPPPRTRGFEAHRDRCREGGALRCGEERCGDVCGPSRHGCSCSRHLEFALEVANPLRQASPREKHVLMHCVRSTAGCVQREQPRPCFFGCASTS